MCSGDLYTAAINVVIVPLYLLSNASGRLSATYPELIAEQNVDLDEFYSVLFIE